MNNEFFPRQIKPQIYAYTDSHPQFKGYLKVGFTTRNIEDRMREHYPTLLPGESLMKWCFWIVLCVKMALISRTMMFTKF